MLNHVHYLLLSIVCSTLILVIFRHMQSGRATTRHAIIVNYCVAGFCGSVVFDLDSAVLDQAWFWPAIGLGLVFYLVFRLIAITAEINGVAAASIATKMGVVIPVAMGLLFLGESLSLTKFVGLLRLETR